MSDAWRGQAMGAACSRRQLLILLVLLLVGCRPTPALPTPVLPTVSPVTRQCVYRGQLPDPVCTPGMADPRVTQDNIHSTICTVGYAASIRAEKPESYFADLKTVQMREYGLSLAQRGNVEEDHLIPLELGGSNDERNLWPENGAAPNPKDYVEGRLHAMVCAGSMSLVEAQHRIAMDWTAALP